MKLNWKQRKHFKHLYNLYLKAKSLNRDSSNDGKELKESIKIIQEFRNLKI